MHLQVAAPDAGSSAAGAWTQLGSFSRWWLLGGRKQELAALLAAAVRVDTALHLPTPASGRQSRRRSRAARSMGGSPPARCCWRWPHSSSWPSGATAPCWRPSRSARRRAPWAWRAAPLRRTHWPRWWRLWAAPCCHATSASARWASLVAASSSSLRRPPSLASSEHATAVQCSQPVRGGATLAGASGPRSLDFVKCHTGVPSHWTLVQAACKQRDCPLRTPVQQ